MSEDVFERVVSTLDYPMYVVTAWNGTERSGCLIGFSTQCSIKPRRWLACLSKKNHTYGVAQGTDTLIVHPLRAEQYALAHIFGGETTDAVDKFTQCVWREGPGGIPVLEGCDWFAGRILERFDLGDHEGQLLDVFDAGHEHDVRPQLGFQSIRGMTPGHAP